LDVRLRRAEIIHLRPAIRFLIPANVLLASVIIFLKAAIIFRQSAIGFRQAANIFLLVRVGCLIYPRVMDETPPVADTNNIPVPTLPRGPLLQAIGDETRWQILRELALGEPRMVKEIAEVIRRSESVAAKHLAVLRRAGITQIGRGRLQQIRPQFIVDPQARVLDFGYLQLRLLVEPA
jgi:DNA-binding transcriptional ArsR family regulator